MQQSQRLHHESKCFKIVSRGAGAGRDRGILEACAPSSQGVHIPTEPRDTGGDALRDCEPVKAKHGDWGTIVSYRIRKRLSKACREHRAAATVRH